MQYCPKITEMQYIKSIYRPSPTSTIDIDNKVNKAIDLFSLVTVL